MSRMQSVQVEIYPKIVIFEDSCKSHHMKDMNNFVNGPFHSQLKIGLNTISLHPYAYLAGQHLANHYSSSCTFARLTSPIAQAHRRWSRTRLL